MDQAFTDCAHAGRLDSAHNLETRPRAGYAGDAGADEGRDLQHTGNKQTMKPKTPLQTMTEIEPLLEVESERASNPARRLSILAILDRVRDCLAENGM